VVNRGVTRGEKFNEKITDGNENQTHMVQRWKHVARAGQ
jgi:hypothetical protein